MAIRRQWLRVSRENPAHPSPYRYTEARAPATRRVGYHPCTGCGRLYVMETGGPGSWDDRELVSRILDGERDLFTTLVRRYEKRVVNYVYRITRRWEESHDLAQEIFMKVYLALDRYDSKFQFSTWLFRIAQNSAIDMIRKKSLNEVSMTVGGEGEGDEREREIEDEDSISPHRALHNKEMAAAIDEAVENLPDDYRELIQLRHFAELSYEEIATMKKLPLGTVKNKLFRARNMLKNELESFSGSP